MNPASRIPLEISCWFLDDGSTVDNQCSEWSELCGTRASITLTVSYGDTSSHRMLSINLRQMEEIPGDGKHLASVNPENGLSGFHLRGAWPGLQVACTSSPCLDQRVRLRFEHLILIVKHFLMRKKDQG